jgi:hypothetical protein
MKLDVTIDLSEVQKMLSDMPNTVRTAARNTLNDGAFFARDRVYDKMREKFKGGPTPYSLRAFKVDKADKQTLQASTGLRVDGPGKGGYYEKVLGHLFKGGSREYKRMEGAFYRLGVLNTGYAMVPAAGCPLDAFGNPKPSFITQLISYFGGFSEQGYRANMTDKRKRSLAKISYLNAEKRKSPIINGVVYFISRGPGNWFGARSWQQGKYQHLPAGIWQKTGIHGVKVQPVFLFAKRGNYKQIINLEEIKDLTQEQLIKIFEREIAVGYQKNRG